MGWSVQPLLFFLARCTRNKLIKHIEFLKAENEMLRKRVPKQKIWLKPDEKARLVKLANGIVMRRVRANAVAMTSQYCEKNVYRKC